MLPEELSKVTNQPNATVHFPSVASLTIPRRPTNVLSGKIPTKFFFSIILLHIHTCTIDNIQHLINSSEVNILKDNCILKSFRP